MAPPAAADPLAVAARIWPPHNNSDKTPALLCWLSSTSYCCINITFVLWMKIQFNDWLLSRNIKPRAEAAGKTAWPCDTDRETWERSLNKNFFRASRLFKEFVKTVCITECRSRGRFQTIYSIILIIIDGNVLIYVWAFLIRPVNRSVHDFMIHPCTWASSFFSVGFRYLKDTLARLTWLEYVSILARVYCTRNNLLVVLYNFPIAISVSL